MWAGRGLADGLHRRRGDVGTDGSGEPGRSQVVDRPGRREAGEFSLFERLPTGVASHHGDPIAASQSFTTLGLRMPASPRSPGPRLLYAWPHLIGSSPSVTNG
jgi:hypothetical protein